MKNLQGGHEIMNLATGQKIERAHVWERPMSDFVIQAVKKMADDQGVKSLNKQPCSRAISYDLLFQQCLGGWQHKKGMKLKLLRG